MSQFEPRHPIDQITDEARVVSAANGWRSCADTSVRNTIQALTSWGLAAGAGAGTPSHERHTRNALHNLHTAAVYALAAYINACDTLGARNQP